MKLLFYNFFKNLGKCFWGWNLAWHGLAILLTYIIVTTGFDWHYYQATRNEIITFLVFPAIIIGGLLPIISPLILLAVGKIRKNNILVNTAWSLGQAALIGWLISSFYKAFTGRAHPEFGVIISDITKVFNFGFWEKGIFWGWPSSHTTVAFSVAFALIALYPMNKKVKYWALVYALYIGLSVSVSIHWFSDFIAGAIIGTVIGLAVGKGYLNRLVGKKY